MIHDKTITDEIAGLITTKDGRIDHKQSGGHDDTLIAYLYCRWFIMFCKTKGRYIDAAFFNSTLTNMTMSSEQVAYEYVMGNKGVAMTLNESFKQRDSSNNYIKQRLKQAMDDALIDQADNDQRLMNDRESFIEVYDDSPKLEKGEIDVDTIAEEFVEDHHEYSEDLDKDDPEKVAAKTEEQRDTSEDPVNMFKFNFKVDDNFFKAKF